MQLINLLCQAASPFGHDKASYEIIQGVSLMAPLHLAGGEVSVIESMWVGLWTCRARQGRGLIFSGSSAVLLAISGSLVSV